jgi:hypothetical protein
MAFLPLIVLAVVGLAILLRPWPFFLPPDESQASSGQTPERNVTREFVKWVELKASAHGLNVRGVARPIPLECPKCRKNSNYFVYPDEVCERCWRASLKPVTTPVKEDRR